MRPRCANAGDTAEQTITATTIECAMQPTRDLDRFIFEISDISFTSLSFARLARSVMNRIGDEKYRDSEGQFAVPARSTRRTFLHARGHADSIRLAARSTTNLASGVWEQYCQTHGTLSSHFEREERPEQTRRGHQHSTLEVPDLFLFRMSGAVNKKEQNMNL